ncbi:TetR/AcrR family transcriptional regulator, partial [Klebsiella quasipneumoniae]
APKKAPTQSRAVETYERILATAAELLGEVGIERLSTNLVCRRLGLSPPALYQYFPNKYAILHELGQRLMQRQNELLGPWATPATMSLPE